MKILFTNNTLAHPAGTELYLQDVAIALRQQGHEVAAFSTRLGDVAITLVQAGIPSVNDPGQLPWEPDLIHGHHGWETTLAALRWPRTPLLSVCHGPVPWQETPCLAPWTGRYLAVDQLCVDRLTTREGLPPEKVTLIPNGVDLPRFPVRPPLPEKPRRLLVFSNYASDENYLPAVREACRQLGLECGVIGRSAGKPCATPWTELPKYDVVLAKGRAALESLATGCAVLVCDTDGVGPLVTTANFEAIRRVSFGYPVMTQPHTVEAIRESLAAWDSAEQARLTTLVRQTAGLEHTIAQLLQVYGEIRQTFQPPSAEEVTAFTTRFLLSCTDAFKLGRELHHAWTIDGAAPVPTETLLATLAGNRARLAKLEERLTQRDAEKTVLKEKIDSLRAERSRPVPFLQRLRRVFKP